MLENQTSAMGRELRAWLACAAMGLLFFTAPAFAGVDTEIEAGSAGRTVTNPSTAARSAAATRTSVKTRTYGLASPDGKIAMTVKAGETICYSVSMDSKEILKDDQIAMNIETADGKSVVWGEGDKVLKSSTRYVDKTFDTPIYRKDSVRDHFNELTLSFKDFDLVFRAYDDGAAYRFVSKTEGDYIVKNETADFNFAGDWKAYIPYSNTPHDTYEQQFSCSFENITDNVSLSGWQKGRLAFLPLTVDGPDGIKVSITESDLRSYPGMFLANEGASPSGTVASSGAGVANSGAGASLKGVFAGYPKQMKGAAGHSSIQQLVLSREDYIAKTSGARTFPWRVIALAPDACALAETATDLVWNLATPAEGDYSWVKPGKVAWDWWNAWNIGGVDFRAGINTETYKYYIDFASKYGIEYVILDEGWSVKGKDDLLAVIPEIDLQAIVDYGKEKGVGIILWGGFDALRKDLENVCAHYAAMGVKGFKVDFFNRDDQLAVELFDKFAQTAARYKLVLDYHGAPKPSGINRTYPNVLNVEGVHGLEQMKWDEKDDQPAYDAVIPFTRQLAGPLDYTQGAMKNASRRNFRAVNAEPMSMGTRCHQLALYMIFDSPLSMLCDSPTNYLREDECTRFIAGIPVSWDETRVLAAEIGKYAVFARRKDQTWYIGAITDFEERDLDLDLGFISGAVLDVFADGINADRLGTDYARTSLRVPSGGKVRIHLAPGGGWAAKTE